MVEEPKEIARGDWVVSDVVSEALESKTGCSGCVVWRWTVSPLTLTVAAVIQRVHWRIP